MTTFCNGSALGLIAHENAHTYFPFLAGINERKYAWMDEGWAVFLPINLMEKNMPDHNYFERMVSSFEGISGKESESTLMVLSYQIAAYSSYRYHAYVPSSMAYYFLQEALGDSVFKASLYGFIERWKGKHPTPYDFFNTFVNLSGQKLFWFFKPWFFDKAYADMGIKKVTMDNKIVVENVGGLPLPVEVLCEFEDGSTELYKESPAIWRFGEPAIILQVNKDKKISKITIGSDRIPDVNKQNDQMVPLYE